MLDSSSKIELTNKDRTRAQNALGLISSAMIMLAKSLPEKEREETSADSDFMLANKHIRELADKYNLKY